MPRFNNRKRGLELFNLLDYITECADELKNPYDEIHISLKDLKRVSGVSDIDVMRNHVSTILESHSFSRHSYYDEEEKELVVYGTADTAPKRTVLHQNEIKLIIDAYERLGFNDKDFFEKLSKAVGTSDQDDLFGELVYRSEETAFENKYGDLTAAIADNSEIRINYRGVDKTEPSWRTIKPHKLIRVGGDEQLEAWFGKSDEIRHYSLKGIVDIERTGRVFTAPLYAHQKGQDALISVIDERAVSSELLNFGLTYTGDLTKSGHKIAAITDYGTPWLPCRILASGGKLIALSPEDLRHRVRLEADRMLAELDSK